MKGKCYLVGAGPGDIGLYTLRAKELIEQADVIIYDYLANPDALAWAKEEAEVIYVGKKAGQHTMRQEQINGLVVERTERGQHVVRLKGGDPFLFGRGGEEAQELRQAGCEFEIVPGITSASAAAAYTGIPLTHRDFNSTVTFLTGHENPAKEDSSIDWEALVRLGGTFAIYMGMERIRLLMEGLVEKGLPPERKVSVIRWATTGRQQSVHATVADIADRVEQAGLKAPAIMIVGEAASLHAELRWFEHKPMLGIRIVLTRTRKQASRMKKAFQELGADVLELPTIRVEPMEWSVPEMAPYGWLVFTSPNAVDFFMEPYLKENDIRSLAGIRIACVGPATAARLRAMGIQPDFTPGRYTGEALVSEWPSGEGCSGRVLFPCGNLAKQVIGEGLAGKGCQVDRLEVYRTVPEREGWNHRRFCDEGADWVVFASSSAVENFHALELEYPREGCRYAGFGPVTSQTMRDLGYAVDYEAPESRVEVLVEGIRELIRRREPQ